MAEQSEVFYLRVRVTIDPEQGETREDAIADAIRALDDDCFDAEQINK